MGGDGGVIASNRKYMRGAGTADHTADQTKKNGGSQAGGSQQATAYERFTTCALTKAPLFSVADGGGGTRRKVVACPYGRLYFYDAAVSALLRRKQQQQQGQQQNGQGSHNTTNNSKGTVVELESHIRGLKDLYEVRMEMTQPSSSSSSNNMKLICPITDKELNGKIGAILLLPGNKNHPNVISEGALQQLTLDDLNLEYGPIEKQIRLIPTYQMLHDIIKPKVKIEQEQEELQKLFKKKQKQDKKKNTKKRKQNQDKDKEDDNDNDDGHSDKQEKGATTKLRKMSHSNNNNNNNNNNTNNTNNTNKITVASAARGRVASAVESNSVLSSLFVSSNASTTKSNQISEKEKKDNLFAR